MCASALPLLATTVTGLGVGALSATAILVLSRRRGLP